MTDVYFAERSVSERLSKGSRIIVAPSAGPRLAGKHGVVVGNGATKNQVRVLLDSSKHCITLHACFLDSEASLKTILVENREEVYKSPSR